MLRIGQNQYDLVRAQSGFTVFLYPDGDTGLPREQVWILEAHYVPGDTQYTPRADGELEYLNLSFRSEEYAVKDWRKLSGLDLDKAGDSWFGRACVTNLLFNKYKEECLTLRPGWLEVEHLNNFLFHCEFDGEVVRADETVEEVEFKDDIPFGELVVYVPVNAADPVAKARALAKSMIGLTEFGGSKVHPYDPARPTYFNIHINSHHMVTLQTPWRQQLV